jgi:hypothetical protein
MCNKPLTLFAGYIPIKGELCVDCYYHELSLDAQKAEVRKVKQ